MVSLTREQFLGTIDGMIDVTTVAEAVVDIWPYVQELNRNEIVLDYVFNNRLIEHVYTNKDRTFEHILLPTSDQNIFTVIIVNLSLKEIYGHYVLDLNKEYGLNE